MKKNARSGVRRAVVVLGMHRSGTSLLAALLCKAGADAPKQMMAGGVDNPTGHWESWPLYHLDQELLGAFGLAWDSPLSLPAELLRSPKAERFVPRYVETLRDEYGHSDLLCTKDPRLSRLLPVLNRAMAEEGIAPSCLLISRNPLDVAASLKARDGFHWSKSLMLWLRYVLDSELHSRDLPRVFVTYDRLMSDWRGVLRTIGERLEIAWPRRESEIDVDFEKIIAEALRHHHHSDKQLDGRKDVVRWVKAIHHACVAAAENNEDVDRAVFDDVREQMSLADKAYEPLLVDADTQRRTLEASIGEVQVQAETVRGESASLSAKADWLYAQLTARDADLEAAREQADAVRRESDAVRGESDALRSEANTLRDLLSLRDAELKEAREDGVLVNSLTEQTKAARDENAGLRDQSEALREENEALRNRAESLREQLSANEAELEEALHRGEAAASLREETLQSENDALRAESSELGAKAEWLFGQLNARSSELEDERQRGKTLTGERDALHSVNEALRGVGDTLRKQLAALDGELEEAKRTAEAIREQLTAHAIELRESQQKTDDVRSESEALRTKADWLYEQLSTRSAELDEERRHSEAVRAKSDAIRTQVDRVTAESEKLGAKADWLYEQLATRDRELAEERRISQEIRAHISALDAERETLSEKADGFRNQLATRDEELAEIRKRAETLDAQGETLNEKTNWLHNQLATRDEELAEERRTSQEIRVQLSALDAEREALSENADGLRNRLATRDEELGEVRKRAETLDAQGEKLNAKADWLYEQLATRDDELAQERRTSEEIREQLSARDAEREALSEESAALHDELAARDEELVEARKHVEAVRSESEKVSAKADWLYEQLAMRDKELGDAKLALDELASEVAVLKVSREESIVSRSELTAAREQAGLLREQLATLQALLSQRDGDAAANRDELSAVRLESSAMHERLRTVQSELDGLSQQLAIRDRDIAERDARADAMLLEAEARNVELTNLRALLAAERAAKRSAEVQNAILSARSAQMRAQAELEFREGTTATPSPEVSQSGTARSEPVVEAGDRIESLLRELEAARDARDAMRAELALEREALVDSLPELKYTELVAKLAAEDSAAGNAAIAEKIRLPISLEPEVSVIIPTYGKVGYTLQCLASIMNFQSRRTFEVIVAEDASGDPEVELLANIPGVRLLNDAANLGFIGNCNRAAAEARGRYLFFLNNDTEVTSWWLDTLVEVFEAHGDAAIAGSKLVYPDGRLQEAGGIVWRDASAWNYGRLGNPDAPEYSYLRETDYISGAAILVDAGFFKSVGGFDSHYAPAYYEDTDLAFKARAHGRKVYFQPASVVVHYEGISHGTDVGTGIKAYQAINREKFHERWKETLERDHFPNAENVFCARDRSQKKPCVLVIDHYVPQPDRDAGSRATLSAMRGLQKMGVNVKFWPQNRYRDPHYIDLLLQSGIEVFYDSNNGSFEEWIRENGGHIDFALLSRPHVAVEFIEDLRKHSHAKLLYYGHDVHHLRIAKQREIDAGNEILREEEAYWRELEERVWEVVDSVYYFSAEEAAYAAQWLRKRGMATPVRTLPLLAYEDVTASPAANLNQRRDIVFVAGFGHPPNVDAAEWFVSEIFPRIRQSKPGTHLFIVGSNPTNAVKALAGEDITVTGFVSDEQLEAFYTRARVAVAPMRFGAGVKGKVVEAMRHGLPMVTTSVGTQGLAFASDALCASDDPAIFADRVVALLDDDEMWRRLSARSQEIVRREFSIDAMCRGFAGDVFLSGVEV